MLNAYLLFTFGFSLCCMWPHLLGDPTCWSYLPSQGKRTSGWLTHWEGNCQPPWGQGISQLGALPASNGKSLSNSWNAAPRRGAALEQSPSLAPLLRIMLQQAASASHGPVGSITAPVFPGGEHGPSSHPWAAHRQHSWASLNSNLPQPKRRWEPRGVPTAISRGWRKEQLPKPPPCCGQWCLQHSPLSVQSAADSGYLI